MCLHQDHIFVLRGYMHVNQYCTCMHIESDFDHSIQHIALHEFVRQIILVLWAIC